MKKIFTLLLSAGLVTGAFAQSGHDHFKENKDHPRYEKLQVTSRNEHTFTTFSKMQKEEQMKQAMRKFDEAGHHYQLNGRSGFITNKDKKPISKKVDHKIVEDKAVHYSLVTK